MCGRRGASPDRYLSPVKSAPLATTLAGIELRNPIVLAAGTAGLLDEMNDVLDLSCVGAVTTKSITPQAREGNDTWRIIEGRGGIGMFNAIGLANPGLDAFVHGVLQRAARMPCKVFVSVAGFSVEDYVQVAANVDSFASDGGHALANIPLIELNVSCPNVRTGTEFGASAALLTELLRAVRPVVKHCKLFVKLGPMTPEFVQVAKAAVDAGADGLTIANTMPAMVIDVRTRKPVLANITGGLSGPAVHPVAVKLIYDVWRTFGRERKIPIIGLGGVLGWEDAAEFVLAGATAVGVGTGLFADPTCPKRIVRGLEKWVGEQKKASIDELVGALEV